MMKKVLLAVLLLCGLSMLCFAKGSLELFGGIPMNWERGSGYGYEANVQMTSASVGIGLVSSIKENFSWETWDEIIFPVKFDVLTNGDGVKLSRSDYKSLLGMSFVTGPVLNIYSSAEGMLKIPLTFGIRWMWLSMATDNSSTFGSQFGFGAGIGAECHIVKNVYVFGRIMGYYDFLSMSSTVSSGKHGPVTTTNVSFINSLGFTPNIGIGFVF